MALTSGTPGMSRSEQGPIACRRCNYCGRLGSTGEPSQLGIKNGVSIEPDTVDNSNALVTLLQCSGCHVALYCSKEHQRLDWKTRHKPMCKIIQRKRLEESQLPRVNLIANQRALTANELTPSPSQGSTNSYSISFDSLVARNGLSSAVNHCLSDEDKFRSVNQSCDGVDSVRAIQSNAHTSGNLQIGSPASQPRPLELQTSFLHVSNDDDLPSAKIDHSTNKRFNLASDPWFKAIMLNQSRPNITSEISSMSARSGKTSFQEHWPARIQRIAYCVSVSLKRYGWVVLDNFLGPLHCDRVLKDVCQAYDTPGYFTDGQLVKTQSGSQASDIRSDKIHWFDSRTDKDSVHISLLVSIIDSVVARLVDLPYSINGRSKAMVACYPGDGTKYVRHVDNPDQDGRCITSIYYLNHNWIKESGGVLRLYPQTAIEPVDIEPIADRVIFFWSDKRNPHEVLPSYSMRYAITIWYFDKSERDAAKSRGNGSTAFSSGGQQRDESPQHNHYPGQHSVDFVPPTQNQMNHSYQLASLNGASPLFGPPVMSLRPAQVSPEPTSSSVTCATQLVEFKQPAVPALKSVDGVLTLTSSGERTAGVGAMLTPTVTVNDQQLSKSWPAKSKVAADTWHLCRSLLNMDHLQKASSQPPHVLRPSGASNCRNQACCSFNPYRYDFHKRHATNHVQYSHNGRRSLTLTPPAQRTMDISLD